LARDRKKKMGKDRRRMGEIALWEKIASYTRLKREWRRDYDEEKRGA